MPLDHATVPESEPPSEEAQERSDEAAPQRTARLGKVERYDRRGGIVGWFASPQKGGAVELVAGESIIAAVPTDIFRPELRVQISSACAREPWVGFRFPPAALALAEAVAREHRSRPLHVRDVATGQVLPGPTLPTVNEIVAAAAEDASVAAPDRPAPAPSFRGSGELTASLEKLRFDAGKLLSSPLALVGSAHAGYVEIVVKIAPGLFIIGGWTKDTVPPTSTALFLIDGRKVPAALFCAPYERQDLPSDAVAFCAVVRVEADIWRPDQDFILTFANSDRFMRSRQPLKVLTVNQALKWLMNVTKVEANQKTLISEVMRTKLTEPAGPEMFGCHVAVDGINIYPGFGALVRGWVLSPIGDLDSVSVRQGAIRAEARQDRISIKPRPDLAAGFSQFTDRTGRAGFAAVCVGALSADERERPMLTLGLSDGSQLDVPVPSQHVRVGYSIKSVEDLANDFPAYSLESFFPELCRAYARLTRLAEPELHYLRRVEGRNSLMFNMPVPAATARLAISDLARGSRGWSNVAVNILLGPQHDRSAIMRAMHDVLPEREVGIIQYSGSADIAGVVAQILRDGDVRRFAFVQQGARLMPRGWENVRDFFKSKIKATPEIYAIEGTVEGWTDGTAKIGALGWTTQRFLAYARSAIPAIGSGVLGDDLNASPGAELFNGMVKRYHAVKVSASIAQMNCELARVLNKAENRLRL